MDKRSLKSLLFVFVSALISWMIITINGFPYLGLGLGFTLLSTTLFFFKKEKSKWSYILYGLTFVLSAFLVIRANGLLTFLNIVALIYTVPQLVLSNNFLESFWRLVFAPLISIVASVRTENKFPIKTNRLHSHLGRLDIGPNFILSLIITVVVLVIIIPLLSAANPFFSELVKNILKLFNLEKFIKIVFSVTGIIWVIRIAFFLIFALLIPRAVSYILGKKEDGSSNNNSSHGFSLFIPKVAMILVLAVFFVTQAQLYFASPETLKMIGYSNSRQTREVFAQLLVVAFVAFGLIYNERKQNKSAKITTYLLILATLFLDLIAFKSDFDYSRSFGFTEKRLYGFAITAWIAGALAVYFNTFRRNAKGCLIRGLFLLSAAILIVVNAVNFDYLIYHVRPSTTGQGKDVEYLAHLSTDSYSYPQQITDNMKLFKKTKNTPQQYEYSGSVERLLYKISSIRDVYKNADFRTFNVSMYDTYKKTNGIHEKKYRSILYPTTTPIPSPTETIVQEARQITIKFTNLDKRFANAQYFISLSGVTDNDPQRGNVKDSAIIATLKPGLNLMQLSVASPNSDISLFKSREVYMNIPPNMKENVMTIDFSQY